MHNRPATTERVQLQLGTHRIVASGGASLRKLDQSNPRGVLWAATMTLDEVVDGDVVKNARYGAVKFAKLEDRVGEPVQSVVVRHAERLKIHLEGFEDLPPLKEDTSIERQTTDESDSGADTSDQRGTRQSPES